MEDLINLNEYAKQFNISWHTCKQWLNSGLKHVGTRPYLTKQVWINEFLESYSEQSQSKTANYNIKPIKRKINKCNTKIDINDYL